MRANRIRPQFVEFIPDHLEDGVLYVSQRFRTCSHKCCCGCGEEVVTPLSPAEWQLTCERDLVSLWPSIGNWDYVCRSHYVIQRNLIKWVPGMTAKQIARVRQRDASDLADMINVGNCAKDRELSRSPPASPPHALSHSTPSCDKANVVHDKRKGWFMKLLRLCFGD
jgi:hypothetical protein